MMAEPVAPESDASSTTPKKVGGTAPVTPVTIPNSAVAAAAKSSPAAVVETAGNSKAAVAAPAPAASATPTASAIPATVSNGTTVAAGTVASAPHIKEKRPTQRACDEKNEKGKVCCGHLKRWYDYPPEIEKLIGKKTEIYRCEFCQTLYKPDLAEMPHSYTLRY